MKLQPLLIGLLLFQGSCDETRPQSGQQQRPAALIAPEPVSSEEKRFQGCNFDPTPVLAIAPTLNLLDGAPVTESELEQTLDNKQELYATLGSPPLTQLVVQVWKGVPEQRVARLLERARAARFVDITRMNVDPLEPPKRKERPR